VTVEPRVLARVEDSIGHLLLNRPARRNAIDAATVDEARAAMESFARAGVRVAVLEAGGPVFCSGRDRSEQGTGSQSCRRFSEALTSFPIFWAARVQGAVVGGGVMLTAVCPLTVCTPDAWFHQPEAAMGFMPTPTLAYLEARLGIRAALQLCLSDDRVPAARAVELGLVDHVEPVESLDAFLAARLRPLADHPRLAAAATAAWQATFTTPAVHRRVAELVEALGGPV
jgi:enoyl-CoA hydratase/carnithine racemase